MHRDLKPENLLFRTPEDNADLLIADFGLSRIMDEEQFHVLTTTCGTPGYMAPEIFKKSGHGKPVDVWAIGVISYFLLCGYTPFDRDSNLEEMQAILVADYSFTPLEYWRGVSPAARRFIRRCLTVDPTRRMTATDALAHDWIAGPDSGRGDADLLPIVKKNFNARRTLHKAIDTVRAINQLRAAGGAGIGAGAGSSPAPPSADSARPHDEDVDMCDAPRGPSAASPDAALLLDPRGNGHGQTDEQIKEQQRRIEETSQGLWDGRRAGREQQGQTAG